MEEISKYFMYAIDSNKFSLMLVILHLGIDKYFKNLKPRKSSFAIERNRGMLRCKISRLSNVFSNPVEKLEFLLSKYLKILHLSSLFPSHARL